MRIAVSPLLFCSSFLFDTSCVYELCINYLILANHSVFIFLFLPQFLAIPFLWFSSLHSRLRAFNSLFVHERLWMGALRLVYFLYHPGNRIIFSKLFVIIMWKLGLAFEQRVIYEPIMVDVNRTKETERLIVIGLLVNIRIGEHHNHNITTDLRANFVQKNIWA